MLVLDALGCKGGRGESCTAGDVLELHIPADGLRFNLYGPGMPGESREHVLSVWPLGARTLPAAAERGALCWCGVPACDASHCPASHRVLVRVEDTADVTLGGVVLPETAKERPVRWGGAYGVWGGPTACGWLGGSLQQGSDMLQGIACGLSSAWQQAGGSCWCLMSSATLTWWAVLPFARPDPLAQPWE